MEGLFKPATSLQAVQLVAHGAHATVRHLVQLFGVSAQRPERPGAAARGPVAMLLVFTDFQLPEAHNGLHQLQVGTFQAGLQGLAGVLVLEDFFHE